MSRADTLAHEACEACGDTFTRTDGESWKRLCLPCWKVSPAARKAAPDRLATGSTNCARVRALCLSRRPRRHDHEHDQR